MFIVTGSVYIFIILKLSVGRRWMDPFVMKMDIIKSSVVPHSVWKFFGLTTEITVITVTSFELLKTLLTKVYRSRTNCWLLKWLKTGTKVESWLVYATRRRSISRRSKRSGCWRLVPYRLRRQSKGWYIEYEERDGKSEAIYDNCHRLRERCSQSLIYP